MNPSTKIIIFIVATLACLLFLSACQEESVEPSAPRQELETQSDRDSESEAVVAVSAEIYQVKSQQQKLIGDGEVLKKHITDIDNRLQEISEQIIDLKNTDENYADLTRTTPRSDQVSVEPSLPDYRTDLVNDVYAPVTAPSSIPLPPEKFIWYPMDVVLKEEHFASPKPLVSSHVKVNPQSNPNLSKEKTRVIPSGTLIEGRLLTGMIGRIPVSGQVADPWPFKIVATGFAYAPNYKTFDVSGMIFEGVAQGDYSFGCVRGRVHKLTTVTSKGDVISVNGVQGTGIAWVSDDHSNPCLPGAYIGNAASEFSKSIILNAMTGAAGAAAQTEQTSTVSADGIERTAVTGDRLRVIGAKTIANAAKQAKEFISNRSDVWDAIYVAAGGNVIVNISQELSINTTTSKKVYDEN